MKKIVWLVGAALVISGGMFARLHAFSMGAIELRSYLGAPFVAEVPLIIDAYERDKGFVVMIGDAQEYEAEGLPRSPVVDVLRPVVSTDHPARVLLYSEEPIQVPTFDLLLAVRSGSVTIVQNYAITLSASPLSTPVASKPQASEKTVMAKASTPSPTKTLSLKEPPAPAPRKASVATQSVTVTKSRAKAARREKRRRTAATPAVPTWAKALPKVYGPVQGGETLYRVVENLGVPRSFTWQVAVHLWRDNLDRFFAGNIHGLLTGLYLRLPKHQDWHTIITSMSLKEAQYIVDEQWDAWRELRRAALAQPKQQPPTVLSEPAPVKTVHMESQPAEAEDAAASMVLSTQEPSVMVTVNELQSVLQGLEDRLAQRLSVPSTASNEPSDESVSFVSAAELQVALRGLEGRLSEQLQRVATQQQRVAQAGVVLSPSTIPASLQHDAGIETLLGPLFSSGTIIYVLIIQNVVLFTLACGFAWRWYRNRA